MNDAEIDGTSRQDRDANADATLLEQSAPVLAAPVAAFPPAQDQTIPIGTAEQFDDVHADETSVAAKWKVGDVILDTYEVKQVHEGGGMGFVYRVHHKGWNMDVAVKSPRAEYFQTETQKENFTRECETWINLGLHPHVVSCHYVRTLGGIPRVFAEYVEGGSLKDWIESRKLYEGGPQEALKRILDIAIQFAWGLHYAHEYEQHLIHQDVKPANVLMTPDGTAKVTDFGLANARAIVGGDRERAAAGHSTQVPGAGFMTPEYASPEQTAGKPLKRKTDIWSWAVSLYEMFVGEMTWKSGLAVPELLEEYLKMEAKTGSIPQMPEGVVALLRHCFHTDPSDRPKDMAEVVVTLTDVYQQITGETYPREEPKAVELVGDALNNRAVSMLDLGKQEEADKFFEQALKSDPHHPQATYNHGITRWRRGNLTDDGLIRGMEDVCRSHTTEWWDNYLLALVHLERGDCESARTILDDIAVVPDVHPEIDWALSCTCSGVNTSRRLLKCVEGHKDAVTSACMTPDGQHVVSGSLDSTLSVWEFPSGRHTLTIQTGAGIQSLCLSSNGQFVFVGTNNGKVELWDLHTSQQLQSHKGHASSHDTDVISVSMSDGMRYALSGGSDRKALLWDLHNERCLRVLGNHREPVRAVSLSKDGRHAFTGSGRAIRLWDRETGKAVCDFIGHEGVITALSLGEGTGHLLSGAGDGRVKLWDLASGQCLRTFEGHMNQVTSVSLSADARHAFSADGDGIARFWEIETGRCLRTFRTCEVQGRGPWWRFVTVCIRGDAKQAASASVDGKLRIWNLGWDMKSPLAVCRAVPSREVYTAEKAYSEALEQANLALEDGNAVAAAGFLRKARLQSGHSRSPEVMEQWGKLYLRLPRTTLAGAWKAGTFEGHTRAVTSVCISPDGQQAVSGSGDGTIRVWDIANRTCVRTKSAHEDTVLSLCLNKDGHTLMSGSEDWTAKLWDIRDARCLHTYPHRSYVRSVAMLSGGSLALTGGPGSPRDCILFWHLGSSGPLLGFAQEEYVQSLSISPDERLVVSGSDYGHISVWRIPSGELFRTCQGQGVYSLSFSPSGRHIVSGGLGKTLDVWDLYTGSCLRSLSGHTGTIRAVCASADSKYAFSGSEDSTVKVWAIESGKCLHTLKGHDATVTCLALSPDNRYLLTGSNDHTLGLWVLDWDLEEKQPADWDAGAQSYLEAFLTLRMPYNGSLDRGRVLSAGEVIRALTRSGSPQWNADDFAGLLHTLGCAGYGWLRPEGVQKELEKMVANWQGPPPLPCEPDQKKNRLH